jgi:hypothetical protein
VAVVVAWVGGWVDGRVDMFRREATRRHALWPCADEKAAAADRAALLRRGPCVCCANQAQRSWQAAASHLKSTCTRGTGSALLACSCRLDTAVGQQALSLEAQQNSPWDML